MKIYYDAPARGNIPDIQVSDEDFINAGEYDYIAEHISNNTDCFSPRDSVIHRLCFSPITGEEKVNLFCETENGKKLLETFDARNLSHRIAGSYTNQVYSFWKIPAIMSTIEDVCTRYHKEELINGKIYVNTLYSGIGFIRAQTGQVLLGCRCFIIDASCIKLMDCTCSIQQLTKIKLGTLDFYPDNSNKAIHITLTSFAGAPSDAITRVTRAADSFTMYKFNSMVGAPMGIHTCPISIDDNRIDIPADTNIEQYIAEQINCSTGKKVRLKPVLDLL